MNRLKHTPGPWEVRFRKPGLPLASGASHYIYPAGADLYRGLAIATVPAHDHKTKHGNVEVHKANARLIAAAPVLLDACRAMLQYMGQTGVNQFAAKEWPWNLLIDAIAEAEGIE